MREPETHRRAADSTPRGRDAVRMPLKIVLTLESLGTVGVGLWLLWVTAVVLPARDQAQIPMWRTVAAACLGFSVLCWASVVDDARAAVLRWAVLAASVAAIGFGVYGIVAMLREADAGGRFEGYIVLMGLIFSAHGLTGVAYALLAGRGRDTVAGPGVGLPGVASR